MAAARGSADGCVGRLPLWGPGGWLAGQPPACHLSGARCIKLEVVACAFINSGGQSSFLWGCVLGNGQAHGSGGGGGEAPKGGLAALCAVVQQEERDAFRAALAEATDRCDPA